MVEEVEAGLGGAVLAGAEAHAGVEGDDAVVGFGGEVFPGGAHDEAAGNAHDVEETFEGFLPVFIAQGGDGGGEGEFEDAGGVGECGEHGLDGIGVFEKDVEAGLAGFDVFPDGGGKEFAVEHFEEGVGGFAGDEAGDDFEFGAHGCFPLLPTV